MRVKPVDEVRARRDIPPAIAAELTALDRDFAHLPSGGRFAAMRRNWSPALEAWVAIQSTNYPRRSGRTPPVPGDEEKRRG